MDTLFSVDAKTIVIAGAGGGIGGRFAHALAARGAPCVLADLDEQRLCDVSRDWPGAEPPLRIPTVKTLGQPGPTTEVANCV